MSDDKTTRAGIKREGDMIVIRIPVAEAHSLRVALAPCICKGPKSNSTEAIRDRLSGAIARALATGR